MRKTESLLGFKPSIDLRHGVEKIIQVTKALNDNQLREKQHYYLSLSEII